MLEKWADVLRMFGRYFVDVGLFSAKTPPRIFAGCHGYLIQDILSVFCGNSVGIDRREFY